MDTEDWDTRGGGKVRHEGSGCRLDDNVARTFTESCPLLTTKGKVAIGLVVAIVVFLILIIFYCHQRNKK
ncbi:unnamed protein product [Dibothriocephalus latus]|uniref:Uncharacterized protein n=1 Tax=Dibothriocephalus latus TaxID=60516 RepID=A0A3P7NQX5_DIBLA|nr:unnamed protein product [Dibothriocephalus latus]